MRRVPASAGGHLWVRWSRRNGLYLRLAGCFLFVALATAFVGFHAQAILIWVANGLLLTYLLLAPRRRWAAYLCAGFAGQLFGSELVYPHLGYNLLMTSLNVVEVLISALLLRRRTNELPRFTDRAYLLRFLGYAVLAGPVAVGLIYALISAVWLHNAPWRALQEWVVSDGLGAAVSTPAFVAVFQSRFRETVNWKSNWIYAALFAAATIAGFVQFQVPVLFLVYPLLILILLRMGLAWAALSALFAAGVGTRCTMAGLGPFAAMGTVAPGQSGIMMQAFLAVGMFMVYTVSVVIESQRATEQRLQKIAALHELVSRNSRDTIILSDFDGNRSYVSRADHSVAGWTPEELLKQRTFEVMHPDDRAKAEAVLRELRAGAEWATIECRVRKATGGYVWVEGSLRVVRNPVTGARSGILNVVRDVSERKVAEQAREFNLLVLGAIHDVSLDGILVVNAEDNVVSYNKRFLEVWRVTAPEIPAGLLEKSIDLADAQLLSQCVDLTKDPEGFLKRVEELYADPEANDRCQVELKDGRTLERYSTGLRSDLGQYLGRVWFFRDITDRILAEQKLHDAYKTVEALAAIDSLTGLANRRRFDERLEVEWRRGIRDRNPLSLLVVDVDHFKSYNDNYGHLRGDSCLKQIAESAQDVARRAGDLVARFGGDELTIIMANTANEGAMRIGNEICQAVRDRLLPHVTNAGGFVSVSIGCATLVPKLGQDAAALIELADRALYCAKREGRDRVSNSNRLPDDESAPGDNGVPGAVIGGLA